MSSKLTAEDIRQGLADQETAWSDFEFGQSHFEWGLDTIKELSSERHALREMLAKHHTSLKPGEQCEECDAGRK